MPSPIRAAGTGPRSSLRPKATALALLGAIAAAGTAAAGAADFVLVKNAKNDTAQLQRNELRDLVQGKKKTWKNGTHVDLLLSPDGTPELKWLANEALGIPESVLMTKIKEQVFKGEMKKPATVANSQDCVAEVKKSAGAFCVVDAATAKALPADVAVLPFTK